MLHLPRGRDRRTGVETSPRRADGTRWCREGDVVGRALVPMEGFTAHQATKFTGCSARQLRYWDQIDLVNPSIQGTGGRPGVPRLYSFRDLVALRVVKSLLDNGMSLQRVRRAWDYLNRRAALDKHLSEVKLITDGVSIFKIARRNGEIIDALREGQLAFFVAIDEIATRGGEQGRSVPRGPRSLRPGAPRGGGPSADRPLTLAATGPAGTSRRSDGSGPRPCGAPGSPGGRPRPRPWPPRGSVPAPRTPRASPGS